MKIIKIAKGYFKGIIENFKDLWVLSLIIDKNTIVRGKGKRKIKKGEKEEIKIYNFEIKVEKVKLEENRLRVIGKVINEIKDVPKGSYHGLTFPLQSTIELKKEFEDWEIKELKRLQRWKRYLIVCFDEEQAIFYSLNSLLKELFTIHNKHGKKEILENESLLRKYIAEIYKKVEELLKKENFAKAIIGSIAFYNEIFKEYINQSVSNKIILVKITHVLSGVKEIIKNYLGKIEKESDIAIQYEKVEEAFKELKKEGLIEVGIKNCLKNAEIGNVKELLILDELLLDKELSSKIFELSRKFNFPVIVINSRNDAGKQIKSFGAIAFLRYKLL